VNFQKEDRKNERVGMLVSTVVHSALLLLFFFLLAWKEPFPPIPEYGIELNFGVDDSGNGDVQQQNITPSPINNESQSQAEANEDAESEEVEEIVEERFEQTEAVAEEKVLTEESVTEEPVEEIADSPDSPDVKTEESEAAPTSANEVENIEELVKEPTAAEQPAESEATPGGSNQGDDPNAIGDKGDPQGEIDERALLGVPGAGSDGASLDMAGWMWDELPKPDDRSDEVGKIVFQIQVDSDGYITSISRIQSNVSPAVESIYRNEIEQLTFQKIGGANAPRQSTGRITFIIKSN